MKTEQVQPLALAARSRRTWYARLRAYSMAVALNVAVTAALPTGRLGPNPAIVAVAPDPDRPFDSREVGGPAVILTLPFAPGGATPLIRAFDLN